MIDIPTERTKRIALDLDADQATTLAVMLMSVATRSEEQARRVHDLRPGSPLATRARQRADKHLAIYNLYNVARNMPTYTADDLV